MQHSQADDAGHPDVAFYYPGWIWNNADCLKNLLLFFDGIALLVPAYMQDRVDWVDHEITVPLLDAGLLHRLRPEELVDKAATEKLAHSLDNILDTGLLEPLASGATRFHELSYSRLGAFGDQRLANEIVCKLKARGLAKDSKDGVSIPLHPLVHTLVLVLLAQILRPYGRHRGLALQPATDRPQLVESLREVLSLASMPSTGHVVGTDIATVGVDLSHVPLDEASRSEALADRVEEIEDLASDIKQRSRGQWKHAASLGLAIAGAAWSALAGDPVGPIISGLQELLGGQEGEPASYEAYAYLFRAGQDLP